MQKKLLSYLGQILEKTQTLKQRQEETDRIFDILCWTTEKWDKRGIHNAPYGIPHKSLLKPFESNEHKSCVAKGSKDRNKYVVFEDLERATGPKVHQVDCFYYKMA